MLEAKRDVAADDALEPDHELGHLADEIAGANRAKDELIASCPHEMRDTLTAILSWSFLLREAADNEGTRRAAEQDRAEMRSCRWQSSEDLTMSSRAIKGKLRVKARHDRAGSVISAAVESGRWRRGEEHPACRWLGAYGYRHGSGDPARYRGGWEYSSQTTSSSRLTVGEFDVRLGRVVGPLH